MVALTKFKFSEEISQMLKKCKGITIPKDRSDLVSRTFGSFGNNTFEVGYEVNGKLYKEATVVRCKNGAVVNYTDDYMRRRDPECLIVADDLPSDKPRYKDVYKKDFAELRQKTFEWIGEQELILAPIMAGGPEYGYPAVLIAPRNAAFFACGLAGLQHFVNIDEYEGDFVPKLIILLAPPFRHTHFDGKQIVVHNRTPDIYEMFSYNLYPGPSAKKGVFGFLLDVGEREGWITAHASAVKIVTPYENEIVLMHEGASGGGKSEMGEHIHRESDGKILLAKNLVSNESFYIKLEENCDLFPVADDMVLCHPKMQNNSQKLVIGDAEDGWFLRLDHIKQYGTEPFNEKIFIHPSEPLVFLNIQGTPNATCLVWEHTMDSNGKPCPNPRVILPRRMIPTIINKPVEVDVRSFGVRTPPCTKDVPTYGILGMIQILPPALAWIWRLVAPRGHNNPSIVDSEGITSEGIGSYGPFLTGKRVAHANILLEQIEKSFATRYILLPNQHIGCYYVGFKPQWIIREYLARRGTASFKIQHLLPARYPLLGYCLDQLKVDGQFIGKAFLQPETQPEVGLEAYDAGAKILDKFIKEELEKYNTSELCATGKKIIECCKNDGTLEDYLSFLPMKY